MPFLCAEAPQYLTEAVGVTLLEVDGTSEEAFVRSHGTEQRQTEVLIRSAREATQVVVFR